MAACKNAEGDSSSRSGGAGPEDERRRIAEAMIELVAKRGYRDLTVEDLLERAGVERAVFDRYFADLGDCYAAVWEECKDGLVTRTSAAFLAADAWRDAMRAAAWAFCRWMQEEPHRARVLLVDVSLGNEKVRTSRDLVFSAYTDLIHLGRHERPDACAPTRATAEGVMGAVWERTGALAKAGAFDELPQHVPQMMYLTVLPYLGSEAAAEELRRGPEDIARYRRGEI